MTSQRAESMRGAAALLTALGLLLPGVAFATGAVSGAGEAAFPAAAGFEQVQLGGLTFGVGAALGEGGAASGQLQATLWEDVVGGAPQAIGVEGEVEGGSVAADGTTTLWGTATVDRGDDLPAWDGVPFSAILTPGTLALEIGGEALPTADLLAGSIAIE